MAASYTTSRDAIRLGGEEFCVIMHNTNHAGAFAFAERVRRQLTANTILLPAGAVVVSVSAGIAVSVEKGKHLHALLREADEALYLAKATGRNKVCPDAVRLAA